MEVTSLRPARLSEEVLQILRDAESSINRSIGAGRDPAAEVFLIALNSNQ